MTLLPPPPTLEIAHEHSVLRAAPHTGGLLLSWVLDGQPVIHWPDDADWSQPSKIRGGNPLLFPFLGRHRVNGQIGLWRDTAGIVRELPMHGFARQSPFAAERDPERHSLRLTLEDSPATHPAYPFSFRFEASYQLTERNTLDVELTTTNTGTSRLPYYAGHHFYFALPHELRSTTVLAMPPSARRVQNADGSISAAEPGATRYTLDETRLHDRFHCLEGTPEQPVQLIAPGLQRVVSLDLNRPGSVPWYAVTTWAETTEADYYCIEPWLGLPDAIHNGQGLRWLDPGQAETAALRITVTTLR
ncbi:aldose epimerase [Paraburkholderia bonniea]|uniref:aldose epimerase family protein n=1 Tax=Paraburkholderia bonniea TaxID=2152891 RepID=UPI002572C515|nr:aldose epimerase [Paraburkholderia bonniea]WJF91059.1 aldose epimerase [Paraburkholderia bonniea]WJF94373.1 aldose epimerase [Paraburkholderia bonniea]